jgi:hypothetical protein
VTSAHQRAKRTQPRMPLIRRAEPFVGRAAGAAGRADTAHTPSGSQEGLPGTRSSSPALRPPPDCRSARSRCFRKFQPSSARRFVFLSTQVLHLDAQQHYFPPHYRYWIGCIRVGRRGRAHEGMNVRSSGLIRHAQSVPKHGLQTINGTSRCAAPRVADCGRLGHGGSGPVGRSGAGAILP